MIEIFEGRLGGGKTYSAVLRIAEHLAKGGTVCTNIRLKLSGLVDFVAECFGLYYENDQLHCLTNQEITHFHDVVPWGALRGSGEDLRVLCVVDEAHLYFNAREWSQTSKQLLAFLTQSDKVSVDVIFISQSLLNIDKQFMRLVQYVWRFRDLDKFKVPGLGIGWPFPWWNILAVQYDYDGATQLNRWFRAKDKRVFKCYETAALLTDFPNTAGKIHKRELQKVKKPNNMAKFLILAGLVVGIIAAVWLVHKIRTPGGGITPSGSLGAPRQVGSGVLNALPGERPRGAYDIYAERFRATYSNHDLRTDQGWYQVGEMSSHGFVVAVSERRARILQPDGRTGWVVAEDMPIKHGIGEDKAGVNTAPDDCCGDVTPAEVGKPVSQATLALQKRRAAKGLPPQQFDDEDETAMNVQSGTGPLLDKMRRIQAGLPPLKSSPSTGAPMR